MQKKTPSDEIISKLESIFPNIKTNIINGYDFYIDESSKFNYKGKSTYLLDRKSLHRAFFKDLNDVEYKKAYDHGMYYKLYDFIRKYTAGYAWKNQHTDTIIVHTV